MEKRESLKKTLNPGEIKLEWIPKNWPLTPLGAYKNAYIQDWQSNPFSIEEIRTEISQGRCKGVGVLGGPCFNERFGLVWVDVDGQSVQSKIEELSHLPYAEALPDTLTICSGRVGRERRLYKVLAEDFEIFVRNKYSWQTDTPGEKLEILWSNLQGVVMGLHPETSGFYTPDGLGFEWATDLPLIPSWLKDVITSKNARMGGAAKRVTRVEGPGFAFSLIQDSSRDRAMAVEAMWSLPSELADDYDTWIMVGQALHSVDDELLEQWDAWSQQSEKYQPGLCERKWASFNAGSGVGLGTLIELSKRVSNVVYERLERENASLPEDDDLDQIEKIRLEQMMMLEGVVEQTIENTTELHHIHEVLEEVVDVVNDFAGQNLVVDESSLDTDSPEPSLPSLKRNPPVNIMRDMILFKMAGSILYDPTQESYYRYSHRSEGVWGKLSSFEMNSIIQNYLDEMHLPKGYSSGTVQSLMDLLGPRLGQVEWNNKPNLLCFKNGVLDTETMTLMPHSRDFYMVTQLPFDYDPSADCPRTKQWIAYTQFNNEEMVKVLQAWLRAVLLGRHQLQMFLELIGAAGAGKAQPNDARILTPDGWRHLDSIKVGDHVIAADGNPSLVMGIYPQGRKEIFSVVFDDGSVAECCNEHLWQIYIGDNRNHYIWTLGQIQEYLKKCPDARISIPLCQPVQFPVQQIQAEPYAYAREVIDLMNSGSESNKIHCIPIQYRLNTISVRLHFLQGLMDLAGSTREDGMCVFECKEEYFASDLASIIRSLGGKVWVRPQKSRSKKNPVVTYRLEFFLHPMFAPFRLNDEKLVEWRKAYNGFAHTKVIDKITFSRYSEARCIYINNPAHLYITDHFVVTHNTSFSNLCVALVGTENTFSTRLSLLESNRFEVSGAYQKKLIVIADSERYGGSVDTLKALTGGDQIRSEQKFQRQASSFVYTGMLVLTANESLQTTDPSSGLFRRRLTVPFSRSRAGQKNIELIAFDALGNPYGYLAGELSGVVNWVLSMSEEEMLEYTKNATNHIKVLKEQKAELLSESNTLIDWMQERIVFDPNAATAVGHKQDAEAGQFSVRNAESWLYASYVDACRKANVREVGRPRFVRLLEDICINQLRVKVLKIKGKRTRHIFKGLAIRKADSFYDGFPSIVDYAFNADKWEYLYGSQETIEEQLKQDLVLEHQPSQLSSGIPDLPF
jgi:phage/plasmid-associated DNA primase